VGSVCEVCFWKVEANPVKIGSGIIQTETILFEVVPLVKPE